MQVIFGSTKLRLASRVNKVDRELHMKDMLMKNFKTTEKLQGQIGA